MIRRIISSQLTTLKLIVLPFSRFVNEMTHGLRGKIDAIALHKTAIFLYAKVDSD